MQQISINFCFHEPYEDVLVDLHNFVSLNRKQTFAICLSLIPIQVRVPYWFFTSCKINEMLKFYFIFRVLCYTCTYTDKWDLLCYNQDVWETHSSISGFVRVRAGDIFQSQRSRKTTLTNYRSDVIIDLCLCFTIVGKK